MYTLHRHHIKYTYLKSNDKCEFLMISRIPLVSHLHIQVPWHSKLLNRKTESYFLMHLAGKNIYIFIFLKRGFDADKIWIK